MERTLSRHTTPVHLWIVGIVSLLWNSFGCYDYTMTKLDPAGYLASMGMSQAAMDYMTGLPAWLTAFWALGVWGSLAGSLLLLARSRHAVTAFAASLGGFVVSQVAEAILPRPAGVMQPAMYVVSGVIAVSLVAQLLYVRRQAANGVLR